MGYSETNKRVPAEVFPPGEFIKDELDELGWTQADLAKIIGQDPSNVSKIISGQTAITPTTAKQLEDALGISAQYWMNLDTAYRLAQEKQDNSAVKRAAKLFTIAPVREMERRQWINKTKTVDELENELIRFFGKSLDEQPKFAAAARASVRAEDEGLTAAQSVWCYRAAKLAGSLKVSRFTRKAFDEGIPKLKALAKHAEQTRLVPRVLADMGIRFVVVEHLEGTHIDGAALWLADDQPVIAMSLRFGRIDNFWHTLAHECSHIRHRDAAVVDTDIVGTDRVESPSETERRADAEACEMLLPAQTIQSFIARVKPFYSKERIVKFAALHNVHSGIVVGQLQFRKEIKYEANREMLVNVREIVTAEAVTDGWGKVVEID